MKKTVLLLFAFMAIISLASSVTAAPVMNETYISVSEIVEESLYDGNEGTTLGENVLEGEGTAENPYRITSAQDFLCASEMVSSNNSLYAAGVYSIEACIDFAEVSFTPMGTENAPFKGTLLGNGHVLKNISLSDIKHFGVVGYMTQGVVSNVHAEYLTHGLTAQNLNRFGGIVGEIYSKSSSKTVTVSGCSANGDVYIKSNDEVVAGGIAGMIEARYSNVYFNDNIANVNLRVVSSTKSYVAGFAGKANAKKDDIYLLIEKCAATGEVYLGDVIGSYAAGFIAYVDCEPKAWTGWAEEMVLLAETETSISKSFVTGNVVSSGKGGAFIADFKDFNKKEVLISKSQTVTALSGGVNMGTICDDDLLSDSVFLTQNMGFDFTNTWEIDDGSLELKNKCESCVMATGTCGENLTWTLTYDGVLTISGSGDMYDWSRASLVPWFDGNHLFVESVVIEDNVTSIGSSAFQSCSELVSVTMGKNVTKIGDDAFHGCINLSNIELPESVENIGDGAFSNCTGLTSIKIPHRVVSIGDMAFHNCNGLTSITIPDSITIIGDDAFGYCTGLVSITVGSENKNYTSENGVLFNKDKTTLICYPACKADTSYSIPDSVTEIGNDAFYNCTNLENLTIGNGVNRIRNLDFYGCTGLTSITVGSENKNYTSENSVVFNKDKTILVCYPAGKADTSYSIPDSVTEIGNYAFYNCTGLANINIGGNVESIGNSAFSGCTGLASVTIPENVKSIGRDVFQDCTGLISVTIGNGITKIEDNSFSGCTGLKSVTFGNSVTSIELGAFSGCTGLTGIQIPESVTSIGVGAFSRCSGLVNITMGEGITSIGRGAFDKTGYYNNSSNWENGVLYIGKYLIEADKNSISGSYNIKQGTKCIADDAFDDCTYLTSITICDGLTSIGEGVFGSCHGIISITIPDSVTIIGDEAFRSCEGLVSVTVGKGIESIGDRVFMDCASLTSITIPENVVYIGHSSFDGCDKLATVYYGGTQTKWNSIEIEKFNDALLEAEIIFLGEPEIKVGDVNGDTRVNIQDVILLAQYCAGWDSAKETAVLDASDTNGDTRVNIQDVILLAQYCAGWEVTLG